MPIDRISPFDSVARYLVAIEERVAWLLTLQHHPEIGFVEELPPETFDVCSDVWISASPPSESWNWRFKAEGLCIA